MKSATTGWRVLAVMILVVVTGLAWQCQAERILREQLAAVCSQRDERLQLQEQNRRLAAVMVSPEEMRLLRAERAILERLRFDIEALRQAGKQSPSAAGAGGGERPDAASLAASQSQPATPEAAMTTALLAASFGDLEALGAILQPTPAALAQAEALLLGLPPEIRQRYSAGSLIALAVASEFPVDGFRMVGGRRLDREAQLTIAYPSSSGEPVRTQLSLRQVGDSWRLVVPPAPVERFAVTIRGAPPLTSP
jgi:hypothetical protein